MSTLSKLEQIQQLESNYLLQNYGRYPLALDRGKGVYLYDVDGNKYLDMLSGIGVNSLGHNHPRISKIIRDQSSKLLHTSNLYYHEYQGKLARKLVEVSGMDRAFFCNSGTEAVEGALKIARSHGHKIHPEKYEIISLENSFHGRTFGALSVTGQPKYRADFEPLLPGVKFIERNDEAALEAAFSDRTAAIIFEGIQGEGGILPVSESFFTKARELCDRYNALMIHDAIQCGVGRPGKYFSYQLLSKPVLPDIIAFAKPVSCGLPMGGVLMRQKAADSLGAGMHGTTFGGGPLVCRVALEFFEILEDLLPQMTRVGDYFRSEMRALQPKFGFIKEVRGAGLMIGVELDMECKAMVKQGFEHGLLFNVTHDKVLRFLPPYILKEKHVDKAVKALKKIFSLY